MYSAPNTVRVKKPKRMRWGEYEVCIFHIIFNSDWITPQEETTWMEELGIGASYIKTDFWEIGYEDVK